MGTEDLLQSAMYRPFVSLVGNTLRQPYSSITIISHKLPRPSIFHLACGPRACPRPPPTWLGSRLGSMAGRLTTVLRG